MATNTSKLGLIKPDFVDVVDVSDLNSNADDIDAAVGAAIVTSATRPGSPWSGQIIFETDTSKTLVWNGTAWVEAGSTIDDLDDIGDVTITTPADGELLTYDSGDWVNQALASSALPAGTILQVLAVTTTTTTSTAAGEVDVSGLSLNITPSSVSSKVLVFVNCQIRAQSSSSNNFVNLNLYRGATKIGAGRAITGNVVGSTDFRGLGSYTILDSPSTTSSTNYKVTIDNEFTTTASTTNLSGHSSLVLMEVSA